MHQQARKTVRGFKREKVHDSYNTHSRLHYFTCGAALLCLFNYDILQLSYLRRKWEDEKYLPKAKWTLLDEVLEKKVLVKGKKFILTHITFYVPFDEAGTSIYAFLRSPPHSE